jgi:hypothetical protein
VKKKIPAAKIEFRPDEKISKIVDSWSRDLDSERIRNAGWSPSYGDLDRLVEDFIGEVRARKKQVRA